MQGERIQCDGDSRIRSGDLRPRWGRMPLWTRVLIAVTPPESGAAQRIIEPGGVTAISPLRCTSACDPNGVAGTEVASFQEIRFVCPGPVWYPPPRCCETRAARKQGLRAVAAEIGPGRFSRPVYIRSILVRCAERCSVCIGCPFQYHHEQFPYAQQVIPGALRACPRIVSHPSCAGRRVGGPQLPIGQPRTLGSYRG